MHRLDDTWFILPHLKYWCEIAQNGVELTHWPLGNLNEILDMYYVIFKWILVIDHWGISGEVALIWMSMDFTDDQSTLVEVIAWCYEAISHSLNQCWSRSLSPYGVTRPQWVNPLAPGDTIPCTRIWSTLVQVMLVAWRHQAITWTNADWSSMRCCDIHLRAISKRRDQAIKN